MLKMLLLVLLSVSDVFDNYSKVRHIKIYPLLLWRPQKFSVSHHILSCLRGQLCFLYFRFFSDPLGHCFVDARSTQGFHLKEKKLTWKEPEELSDLKLYPTWLTRALEVPLQTQGCRSLLEQGCPRSAESVDLSGAFLSGINWSLRGSTGFTVFQVCVFTCCGYRFCDVL